MAGSAGNPDRARRCGRGVVQPPALDAAFKPIAVVPRRLLRLGAHNEARRIFGQSHFANGTVSESKNVLLGLGGIASELPTAIDHLAFEDKADRTPSLAIRLDR